LGAKSLRHATKLKVDKWPLLDLFIHDGDQLDDGMVDILLDWVLRVKVRLRAKGEGENLSS